MKGQNIQRKYSFGINMFNVVLNILIFYFFLNNINKPLKNFKENAYSAIISLLIWYTYFFCRIFLNHFVIKIKT